MPGWLSCARACSAALKRVRLEGLTVPVSGHVQPLLAAVPITVPVSGGMFHLYWLQAAQTLKCSMCLFSFPVFFFFRFSIIK